MSGNTWGSLKPGGPLKRRKGLTATTRLQARTPLERGTPLRYRSAKTAAQYVTRRRIVAEMFLCPEVCEVPDCARTATDPHEPLTRARGGDIWTGTTSDAFALSIIANSTTTNPSGDMSSAS